MLASHKPEEVRPSIALQR